MNIKRITLLLFLFLHPQQFNGTTPEGEISEQAQAARLEAFRQDSCAANIIFYEANTETILGQRAVYDVVLNRAAKSGKTVCEVMKEKNAFSWNIQNSKHTKPLKPFTPDLHKLLERVKIAEDVLGRDYLWFFGKNIKPIWARKMECSVVDSHKFCKLRRNK